MATFTGDVFDKEGDDFDNPINTSEDGQEEGMSAAQMIANNESGMTEEELSDLTYAFQAADMDGGGAIDQEEFSMMLSVMGCDISDAQVEQAIVDAKEGFSAWLKMADAENIAKCQRVWEEYDEDKSGTMDLGEVNNVIEALQNMGFNPSPISAADMDDGELDFDEFSAWFLKQEGLPDTFSAPKANPVPGGAKAESGMRKLTNASMAVTGLALKPLSMLTKQAVAGPTELLKMSAKMAGVREPSPDGQGGGDEEAGREMLDEADLSFAEYVFMMRGGLLQDFLPGDWQERAEDMRKLREAFDTADVDGDNQLELEELEMVVLAMNPKVEVAVEDIHKVWAVLNPEGKDWIPFSEYVAGMIVVKRDRELSKVVPMDVPNRFQLLSLLIDTPINEDQEALIFNKMGALEKGGIEMLRKMGQEPMTKPMIRNVLDQACNGRLHMLTDEQRTRVNSTHFACVFQAFLIAMVTCGIAGMWENYMVISYGTDGARDAYFTCGGVYSDFVDLEDPESEYYNLSLPANPGPHSWDVTFDTNADDRGSNPEKWTNYDPVLVQTANTKWQCLPGTCAAFPTNVTEYLLLGGNAAMGGNWTPASENVFIDGKISGPLVNGKASIEWKGQCVPLKKLSPADPTLDADDHERIITMTILNISMVVLMIVFELTGLMITALRSAVKVSIAIDLRLTPLNEDRAFVANMLVRSVFELGDAEGDVMGVDADGGGEGLTRPLLVNILAIAWIKGRVVISGTLFKLVTSKVVNYDTATWMKPYSGTMFACMLWDAMLCHAIMKGAEVQAIGVTTSVEVFNEIMDKFCPLYESDPSTLSETAKVMILRAIGVAIVQHGSMFPVSCEPTPLSLPNASGSILTVH